MIMILREFVLQAGSSQLRPPQTRQPQPEPPPISLSSRLSLLLSYSSTYSRHDLRKCKEIYSKSEITCVIE